MDDPSEQEKPEKSGKAELDERHYRASLNQLPQTWDEKAADGSDDITCRSLTTHIWKKYDAICAQQQAANFPVSNGKTDCGTSTHG